MAFVDADHACTPDEALGLYPCMNNIPDKAILAVIAIIFSALSADRDEDDSAETISDCGSCWMVLNQHEKLVALANMLLDYAVAQGVITSTTDTLTQAASCMLSKSDEELKAIILCNLCDVLNIYSLTDPN